MHNYAKLYLFTNYTRCFFFTTSTVCKSSQSFTPLRNTLHNSTQQYKTWNVESCSQLYTNRQHVIHLFSTLLNIKKLYTMLHNLTNYQYKSYIQHITNCSQLHTLFQNFTQLWILHNFTNFTKRYAILQITQLYTTLHNCTQLYKSLQHNTTFFYTLQNHTTFHTTIYIYTTSKTIHQLFLHKPAQFFNNTSHNSTTIYSTLQATFNKQNTKLHKTSQNLKNYIYTSQQVRKLHKIVQTNQPNSTIFCTTS